MKRKVERRGIEEEDMWRILLLAQAAAGLHFENYSIVLIKLIKDYTLNWKNQ
jgi:hypothetical protein